MHKLLMIGFNLILAKEILYKIIMTLLYRGFLICQALFLRSWSLFCFGSGLRFLLVQVRSCFKSEYLKPYLSISSETNLK